MSQTWDDIARFLKEIPEVTFEGDQPEYLYRMALDTSPDGEIVEIGTNVGKSTIALAFARKEQGGKPINSVDIYEHPDIRKNLEAAGVDSFAHRIVRASAQAAREWDQPIEMLWIDGDHCAVGAANDIRAWSRYVVPGGRIALHDYPGHKRSMQIWNAVLKTLLGKPYEWRLVGDREAGSIIVFERLAPEVAEGRSRGWSNAMYWASRNLRALIFRWLPGLSRKLVGRVKG